MTNSPPVPPAHQGVLVDLAGLLSGELAPGREREVAGHLDDCDACRREFATIARAAAWLSDAARLGPEPDQVALPALQLPRYGWLTRSQRGPSRLDGTPRRSRWLTAVAAALLVAGGVTGGVIVGRASSTTGNNRTVVALRPAPGGIPVGRTAAGTADLSPAGGMHLNVKGLPAPAGLDFYEIWLFDPPNGRMLAVGVLPNSGTGDYSLPRDVERGYSAVEISLQPNDGNPRYSKLNVLTGTIS